MLYSPLYSIPYLIFLSFIIILIGVEYFCKNTPALKQNVRLLCMTAFMLFFGLRGFVGWDWTNYFPLFKETPLLYENDFISYLNEAFVEKGFIVYISIVKSIWPNYHFFVFISSLIDIFLLNIFLKRYVPRYALGFLVFILMGGFFMETDLMRNTKSILLFVISLKYLIEKKPVPYFLLNIVGCMFHVSSILYLPLYFVLNRNIPRYVFIIIFLLGNILFLLKIQYIKPIVYFLTGIIGGKFSYLANLYLESDGSSSAYGISVGYLERVGTSVLLIIFYNKLVTQYRYSRVFINGFILYFILFFYFAEASTIAIRLGGLFFFSYWVVWPMLVECFTVFSNRKIFIAGLCMYAMIKVYILSNSILYRYDNVLTGTMDYDERYSTFQADSQQLQP